MVLAAGLGTRLRPLTEGCAKPLVPVGDRPALAHVLDRLEAAGFGSVVVNAHHHADDIERFAGARGVRVSREEGELLGTAGGVRRARDAGLVTGDVLVWNGDVLGDFDVAALAGAHTRSTAVATLLVRKRSAGEGNVGVDGGGRVVRLRRSSFGVEASGGEFVGVHVVGASLELPRIGCLVGDVYIPALEAGADVRAQYTESSFVDVGTVEAYLAANLAWLGVRGSWLGVGARVAAGVHVDRSVVGAGASVTGEGPLRGCVVWPGAEARAPLEGAVVTPFCTVTVPVKV
jgi:mannose-1-phosphate guanylyltransferase